MHLIYFYCDFQLEKATGYEIRRRIRAQIRIVKRLISENKLPKTNAPKTDRSRSPGRSKSGTTGYTEYQTKYTRKTSPETKKIDNKLFGHTDLISQKDTSEKITEYQTSYNWKERRSSEHSQITTSSRSRSGSPPTKAQKQQKPLEKDLKKTAPKQDDTKPEWVIQRNLKKVTTTKAPTTSKVFSSSSSTKKTTTSIKESKDTDVITSSYGVGPLDENGTPLFGLKALRAQNKGDKSRCHFPGLFHKVFLFLHL